MAWKKVIVTNNKNGRVWKAKSENFTEIENWKDRNIGNDWGPLEDLTIEETDVTAEVERELLLREERKLAPAKVKEFLEKKNPNINEIRDAIREIALHLGLED